MECGVKLHEEILFQYFVKDLMQLRKTCISPPLQYMHVFINITISNLACNLSRDSNHGASISSPAPRILPIHSASRARIQRHATCFPFTISETRKWILSAIFLSFLGDKLAGQGCESFIDVLTSFGTGL